MAPEKLTDYERRRLENIKRNGQMLAGLKIHSRVDELNSSTKRQRTKSYKLSPEKKSRNEPIIIRKSLRTRGIAPDPATAGGLQDEIDETLNKTYKTQITPKKSPRKSSGPIRMNEAYCGTDSDRKLVETLLGASRKLESSFRVSKEGILGGSCKNELFRCQTLVQGSDDSKSMKLEDSFGEAKGSIDLETLKLKEENVARIVPGRIMAVKFFPCVDMKMIVAANKYGDVAFWNVDSEKEDGNGIYLYHPHSGPVSGIVIHPSSISKMFTCCYDGFIRLMDVEKEVFEMVYSSDSAIFSASQRPNDAKSFYFGEGHGGLSIWDERARKSSSYWDLHEDRINTIDFNPENTNLMATSSTDGTVCIWDLRNISSDKPDSLKKINYKRAVHSAYFSPSGKSLATTSIDDNVRIINGANYEDMTMIYHYNQTGRWLSSFRAIWGWDDSYIFIGNMKRRVDVISAAQGTTAATLESPFMSAIPCRFDVHPFTVGTLVGATSGGQVYLWTSC